MEFGCVPDSLWGFSFSWLPDRRVHCSNPMRFLYLASLDCMSKTNLKFRHPPSLCPLAPTCKKAHDPPQHLSIRLTGQEDEENRLFLPQFDTYVADSRDVCWWFLCQRARNRDMVELIFQGLWSQRPRAALQTCPGLQNPRALKTPGYVCTKPGAACAKESRSAACATCLDTQAALCLPAKHEAEGGA